MGSFRGWRRCVVASASGSSELVELLTRYVVTAFSATFASRAILALACRRNKRSRTGLVNDGREGHIHATANKAHYETSGKEARRQSAAFKLYFFIYAGSTFLHLFTCSIYACLHMLTFLLQYIYLTRSTCFACSTCLNIYKHVATCVYHVFMCLAHVLHLFTFSIYACFTYV